MNKKGDNMPENGKEDRAYEELKRHVGMWGRNNDYNISWNRISDNRFHVKIDKYPNYEDDVFLDFQSFDMFPRDKM